MRLRRVRAPRAKAEWAARENTGLRVVFLFGVVVPGFYLSVLAFLVIVVIFFVLIVVIIAFGDHVDMDRMRLHDFKLRLALRAGEDLALFDLFFVYINFSGATRTPNHVAASFRESNLSRSSII